MVYTGKAGKKTEKQTTMNRYLDIAKELQPLLEYIPTIHPIHQGSKFIPSKGGSTPSKNKRKQLRKKRR